MRTLADGLTAEPGSVLYNRCTIDLADLSVSFEEVPCRNVEDVLGASVAHSNYLPNEISRMPMSRTTR